VAAFCAKAAREDAVLTDGGTTLGDRSRLGEAADGMDRLARLAPADVAVDLKTIADGYHAVAQGADADQVGQRIAPAYQRVGEALARLCR
jgi:hypothetical protein